MSAPTLYCSFCGKSDKEVEALIAGPGVFICDECAELAAGIVAERRAAKRRQELGEHPIG